MPALADDLVQTGQTVGVSTFGYNDYRDRVSGTQSTYETWPAWKDAFGASYSQPLIIDPSGANGPIYILAVGGGSDPQIAIWRNQAASSTVDGWAGQDLAPIWAAPIFGTNAPYSHPSLYDINGHYIVFIGTNTDSHGIAHIMAFDVTNCIESGGAGQMLLNEPDPNASADIVSAPLLMEYQGHYVLIYSDGNSGHYDLLYNIDELASGQSPTSQDPPDWKFLSPGDRTSSSPAPVMNGTGFAVGIDTGSAPGAVYVYRLSDLFTVSGNQLVFTSSAVWYEKFGADAGMDASFCVDPENTYALYYGDSRSNIFCANLNPVSQGGDKYTWENHDIPDNPNLYDAFSNRSPAFSGGTVYFAFGTSIDDPSTSGVIAVDGGQTQWVSNGQDASGNNYLMMGMDQNGNPEASNAQTAPVIVPIQGQDLLIFEGLGDDSVDAIDTAGAGLIVNNGVVPRLSNSLSNYAQGISGEISVADGIIAMGTQDGIFVADFIPTDIGVNKSSFTIQDSFGNKLQANSQGVYSVVAGKQYTVSATVDYVQAPSSGSWPLPDVPVQGFVNTGGSWSGLGNWVSQGDANNTASHPTGGNWYAVPQLQDGKGNTIPPQAVTGLTESATDPTVALNAQGDTRTVEFNWLPSDSDVSSANPYVFLAVAANVNFAANEPLVENYPDVPLYNNVVAVPVDIEVPQLVVTPSAISVSVGQRQGFTATYYPEGQANTAEAAGQDVTTASEWSSSNAGVASVGYSTGLATGQSGGVATLTADYDGLIGQGVLTVQQSPPNISGGGLHFQAVSQYGNISRPEDTAEWTDAVTASLAPENVLGELTYGDPHPDANTVAPPYPPPGAPGAPPAFTRITGWSFAGATLHYPNQAPGYSFDHPLPPPGTEPLWTNSGAMSTGNHLAVFGFKEMWAEDGSAVFDVLAGQNVGPPREYRMEADNVSVLVDYDLTVWHWVATKSGGYWAPVTTSLEHVENLGPVSGQLLVDGTGAAATGI